MATEYAVDEFTLVLNPEERAVLSSLLHESLMEIHSEKRRTEAPRYRDQIQHQEALIRASSTRRLVFIRNGWSRAQNRIR
jgi:hypothetical protein